jgi:hypothetical protein
MRTRAASRRWAASPPRHLRQHEDRRRQGQEGQGRVVNARFAADGAHYLFDPDFCNVASGWEKGIVEKNVQDSRRRIWHRGQSEALRQLRRTQCLAAQALPRGVAGDPHPEHGQFSVAEMLEHEQPQLMPMPAPFDGYVENPGTGVQHLPGDGRAQPLLGAVRMGRAHGEHPAVPRARGAWWPRVSTSASQRLSDRGQTATTGSTTSRWCSASRGRAAQRRAVSPIMPAPLQRLRRPAAQARRRRPGHGAGAGRGAHGGPGSRAGGRRTGAGDPARSAPSTCSTCWGVCNASPPPEGGDGAALTRPACRHRPLRPPARSRPGGGPCVT